MHNIEGKARSLPLVRGPIRAPLSRGFYLCTKVLD
jgi:hypothetical protein